MPNLYLGTATTRPVAARRAGSRLPQQPASSALRRGASLVAEAVAVRRGRDNESSR